MKLLPNGSACVQKAISLADLSERQATKRLLDFLALIDHLSTAPWAASSFDVNDRMIRRMVSSHLPLIVGHDLYTRHKQVLDNIVGSPDVCSNIVWVTNRQQVTLSARILV